MSWFVTGGSATGIRAPFGSRRRRCLCELSLAPLRAFPWLFFGSFRSAGRPLARPDRLRSLRGRTPPHQPDPVLHVVRQHRPQQLRSRLVQSLPSKLAQPHPLFQPGVGKLRYLRPPPVQRLRFLALHPLPMRFHNLVFARLRQRSPPLETLRATLPPQRAFPAIRPARLILPILAAPLARAAPVA